jgi:hypothetical protein
MFYALLAATLALGIPACVIGDYVRKKDPVNAVRLLTIGQALAWAGLSCTIAAFFTGS